MNTGVYRITCLVNGKCYIGSTAKSFKERWQCHTQLLRKNRHHSAKLQNAWNKYGEESFEFAVILTCNPSDVIQHEQRCFDEMRPHYNMAPVAGNCAGLKHSEETKRKTGERMRASARRYFVRGEWLSLLEISEKYGLLKSTLSVRVKRGELGEGLIAPQRAPNVGKGYKAFVRGEWLGTPQIVKKYGLSKATVVKRFKQGLTGEDLIAQPLPHEEIVKLSIVKRSDNYRRISVNGESLTVSQIAKKYGISQATIEGRLHAGVTGEDIVKPVKKMNNDTAKRHVVHGESLTVKEIAQRYNLSEVTVRGRLLVGWSGDSLALPPNKKNRPTRAA